MKNFSLSKAKDYASKTRKKRVLIVGANSDIAKATVRRFATEGTFDFYLASQDVESLSIFAKDIKIRSNADAQCLFFDITDFSSHRQFYQKLNPKPDILMLFAGCMFDQDILEKDTSKLLTLFNTNLIGPINFLNIVAQDFASRGGGCIIAVSSVAGERGRKRNFIYGASKSGLTTYLSGLRAKLFNKNVKVITVKPGFVRTKMTENINFPKILSASPEKVAEDIFQAYLKNRDEIYTPHFWKFIMFIIKALPEKLFKRLDL